jgi:tyrosyl-tRNA synthetase
MSISDGLMWRYYELLSDKHLDEIQSLRCKVEDGSLHPMEAKKALGIEIVGRFHGAAAANRAREYFETKYQKKVMPVEVRQHFTTPEPIWICRLMVDVLKFAKSTSEARRLIAQGAVKVDGKVVHDVNFRFHYPPNEIIEVGKNRIAQAAKIS